MPLTMASFKHSSEDDNPKASFASLPSQVLQNFQVKQLKPAKKNPSPMLCKTSIRKKISLLFGLTWTCSYTAHPLHIRKEIII